MKLRVYKEGRGKLRTNQPQGADPNLVDEHEIVAPVPVFPCSLFSRISLTINWTECGSHTSADCNGLLNFLAIQLNYTPPNGTGSFNDGLLAWHQRAWTDWVPTNPGTTGKDSN